MKIIRALDRQFVGMHERSIALVRSLPQDTLYRQPPVARAGIFPAHSVGEHILRAAAVVEQTAGGITANLWDDPFEWTLPETLPAPDDVLAYLDEAEETRLRAFALFNSDLDLTREIATPSGAMQTLFEVVCDTLARAAHHQGRAYATFRLFSDTRLPRI